MTRDHPRMRGDGGVIDGMPWRSSGSPPHARGRPTRTPPTALRAGITPACAGTADRCGHVARLDRDHPRMRGDGNMGTIYVANSVGSPPHARGRLQGVPVAGAAVGITPACAGTAPFGWLLVRWGGDHPRMRGDGTPPRGCGPQGPGSPPHARGRRMEKRQIGVAFGITPACAGTAWPHAWRAASPGDHPRMRGDGQIAGAPGAGGVGSPPHARGRPLPVISGLAGGGITPACAGTAPRQPATTTPGGDHPRMRGDGVSVSDRSSSVAGSPPHARGRLPGRGGHDEGDGITPACAGTAHSAHQLARRRGDHPRMRGDGGASGGASGGGPGSPPHARGRPGHAREGGPGCGITPACAGTACRARIPSPSPWDHPRMRGDGTGNLAGSKRTRRPVSFTLLSEGSGPTSVISSGSAPTVPTPF